MTRSNDQDGYGPAFNRRKFIATSAAAGGMVGVAAVPWSAPAADSMPDPASRQASGMKIGEVTDTSAIVWTRLTANATRNTTGQMLVGHVRRNDDQPEVGDPNQLAAACPGAAGRIRVRYGISQDLADARETPWADVSSKTDYSHQFQLSGLQPATVYHLAVETSGPDGSPPHAPCQGRFETASAVDQAGRREFLRDLLPDVRRH